MPDYGAGSLVVKAPCRTERFHLPRVHLRVLRV